MGAVHALTSYAVYTLKTTRRVSAILHNLRSPHSALGEEICLICEDSAQEGKDEVLGQGAYQVFTRWVIVGVGG